MASLRDVFDHAGRRVQVLSEGAVRGEGKAVVRGTTLLVEAKLAPRTEDVIVFVDSGDRLRVVRADPQFFGEKIDHYRVEGAPLRG